MRASQLPAYGEFRANLPVSASARHGDPHATGPAILAIAEREAWHDLSRQAFG